MKAEEIEILRESAVFSGLGKEEIASVLGRVSYQTRNYLKGELIAQSGTPCNHARIILQGKVAGEMMDMSGKILKIEDMGPSNMIAPAFLYGNRRSYPVNVIAAEDCKIWQMRREEFSKLLQKELRLLDAFLSAISNRAQFLSEKIRFLSFPSLKAKLAFLFLQYSGGEKEFSLSMTHQQISELFGVARPSLTREIRMLNKDGLIASEREQIRILDFERLRALLNEQ